MNPEIELAIKNIINFACDDEVGTINSSEYYMGILHSLSNLLRTNDEIEDRIEYKAVEESKN